jgi:POT family proton-dependent oligopeptide transporter
MAGGSEPLPPMKSEYDLQAMDNIRDADTVTPDGDEPTDFELQTLRKVADKLPWSAFLVAIVELCERFTYNGLSGPFQNYISNSAHDPSGLPGAIGMNQQGATGLTNFFQFWCMSLPPRLIDETRG